MQLACPNCDAKYEVPDDAIPEAGRDVQCSGCGHAWFQLPGQSEPEPYSAAESPAVPPAEREVHADDRLTGDAFPGGSEDWDEEETLEEEALPPLPAFAPAPPLNTATPPAPFAEPEPPEPAFTPAAELVADQPAAESRLSGLIAAHENQFAGQPGAEPGAADDGYDEELSEPPAQSPVAAAAPPPPPPAPVSQAATRRDLEDSVLAILREEAELEAEARRLEAQRLANRRLAAEAEMQIQPDLGVDQAVAAPAQTAAQKRLAMLRGEDLEDPPATAAPGAENARPAMARRDLLPDVEEINSTLKPEENGFDADAEVDALPDLTRGNSFRSGFVLVLILMIFGTIAYILADTISAAFPAAKAPLDGFVGFIDGLRLWLNGLMDKASEALRPGSGG